MGKSLRIQFSDRIFSISFIFASASSGICGEASAPPAPPNRATLGQEIWTAHDQIVIFDASSRKRLETIAVDEVVNGIAFSLDGSLAFVGTSGGKDPEKSRGGLLVVDAAARKVLEKVTENPVKEVRLAPGGKSLHILDWKVRQEERPGGKKRPVADPFYLRAFDVSGPRLREIASVAAGMDLYDFAVSPDGKTAYLLDPTHNALRVMDLPSGLFSGIVDLTGGKKSDGTWFESAPAKLVLEDAGARAAVLLNGSSRTGVVLVDLDRRTRRQIILENGSSIRAGCFLPDGKTLAVVALQRILVIDLEAGKLLRMIPLPETFGSIAVSRDGKEIYLGAPVALRTAGALGGGLVQVRDGESFGLLTDIPVPITVKFLHAAPLRAKPER
jgi:DNA-binding beta-propeller fold protein YncE